MKRVAAHSLVYFDVSAERSAVVIYRGDWGSKFVTFLTVYQATQSCTQSDW